MKLTKQDKELIETAKKTAAKFSKNRWKGKQISTIGCAAKAGKNIFTGANLRHPHSSPSSLCAEEVTLSAAYSKGVRKIDTVVAYSHDNGIYSPCGHCREFMRLFGNPQVIVSKTRKERLGKTLPFE